MEEMQTVIERDQSKVQSLEDRLVYQQVFPVFVPLRV